MDGLAVFGLNLKLTRIRKDFTQESLALISGMDRSYVGELERGNRNPSLLIMIKLCKAMDCPITDLTTGIVL